MLLLLIMDGFCILLSTIITVLNTFGSERRREIKRQEAERERRTEGAGGYAGGHSLPGVRVRRIFLDLHSLTMLF
jgi:hypothetical protein